jgi:uncharacterized protein (DUF488 family)
MNRIASRDTLKIFLHGAPNHQNLLSDCDTMSGRDEKLRIETELFRPL